MNVLVLRDLEVENANALSSPITVGFPSLPAWLGFVHALERALSHHNDELSGVRFVRFGVLCHDFQLLAYRGDYGTYECSMPKRTLKKNGKTPAFIPEAFCHLKVSVVIQYENLSSRFEDEAKKAIERFLLRARIAGGTMTNHGEVFYDYVSEGDDEGLTLEYKKILNRLSPGYALVSLADLLEQYCQEHEVDSITGLLELLSSYREELSETKGEKKFSEWSRKEQGWLVPISVGYQAISEPLRGVPQARDVETPHAFAEAVVTLGEFVMPNVLKNLEELLWKPIYEPESGLYLCRNIF